jgi:hypothetical protein
VWFTRRSPLTFEDARRGDTALRAGAPFDPTSTVRTSGVAIFTAHVLGCASTSNPAATVTSGGDIAMHGAQDRRTRDSGHDADTCWVEQFECIRSGSAGRLPPACDHEQHR